MRIALLIVLALALAACGKKKSPQAPASSTESEMTNDVEEKSTDAPVDPDEAPTTRSSDPQEGGE